MRIIIALGVVMSVLMGAAMLASQNTGDTRFRADVSAEQTPDEAARPARREDDHVARAKTAAGDAYQNLFNFLCTVPAARGGPPRGGAPQGGGPRGTGPQGGGPRDTGPQGGRSVAANATPDKPAWYAAPVKVFDNLYFVGQSEYSAWAVTSSAGIILIDTLFDYAVEEEVVRGLKTLGLDPATIKYAVVTHPHPDHHGGAKFLQDRYGTRIVMSAADWDVLERTTGTKPARDMVASDGQRLTLGDATVTLYVTPGHTPGTLSVVIPVRDSVSVGAAGAGTPHVAALWGGTGLNADRESLQAYIRSAERFDDIVRQAGADIILSNHTDWDGSKVNLPRVAMRTPGSPHPYVVGTAAARRFLEVARECATARLLRLN